MRKGERGMLNKPVELYRDTLRIIDQSRLPDLMRYEYIYTLSEGVKAISELKVRGAPLIAIFASYLVAMLAIRSKERNFKRLKNRLLKAIDKIENTRPTAVNLFKAMREMRDVIQKAEDREHLIKDLREKAEELDRKESMNCEKIAEYGLSLFEKGKKYRIMTICNTGYFATNHIGTALGIIYKLHEKGMLERVYVPETRPLLQGARLTMWELSQNSVPAVLITDNATGFVIEKEKIDAIIVGADRIAKNGDTANKIGTLNLAILANHFDIPFYVAAPFTSVDVNISSGLEIPIEKRSEDEVKWVRKCLITKEDARALNYAFDVTPNFLISGIITDRGIFRKPYNLT